MPSLVDKETMIRISNEVEAYAEEIGLAQAMKDYNESLERCAKIDNRIFEAEFLERFEDYLVYMIEYAVFKPEWTKEKIDILFEFQKHVKEEIHDALTSKRGRDSKSYQELDYRNGQTKTSASTNVGSQRGWSSLPSRLWAFIWGLPRS